MIPGLIPEPRYHFTNIMPILSVENQNQVARILGLFDDQEAWNQYRGEFENDFTQANYDRILEIIQLISGKPTGNDPCEVGGVDYQIQQISLSTPLKSADKLVFDSNGQIKRLRVLGDALTQELSNIVSIPIYFNKYRTGGKTSVVTSYHT